MHPGIVIDPWPMSKSTKVGFHPNLAAQLRSILDNVLLPESVGPTTITLGPYINKLKDEFQLCMPKHAI